MAQQILQFPKPMLSSTLDEHSEDNTIFDNEYVEEDVEEEETSHKIVNGAQKCLTCDDYQLLEELKFNDSFCCEHYTRRAIGDFCNKFHHPLQVKSTQKDNPEKGILAKVVYKCTHGFDRSKTRGPAQVRCVQYHNCTTTLGAHPRSLSGSNALGDGQFEHVFSNI